MNDYLFYGAMTEPIAPMDKEGNIDYELLKAQVQFQLDHKIHAIFVSGLTECMVTAIVKNSPNNVSFSYFCNSKNAFLCTSASTEALVAAMSSSNFGSLGV